MKSFNLVILTGLLLSCDIFKQEEGIKPFITLGEKMEKSAMFSDNDQKIIGYICNAFKYKRENFPYTFWNTSFEYLVQQKKCNSSKVSSERINVQFGLSLTFMTDKDYPYSIIQTDETGFLKEICSHYFSSVEANQPLSIYNTTSTDFGIIQQIKVKKDSSIKDDSINKMFILYGQSRSDGSYYTTIVHEISVLTDFSNQDGLVIKHNQIELCEDGRDLKYSFSDFIKSNI